MVQIAPYLLMVLGKLKSDRSLWLDFAPEAILSFLESLQSPASVQDAARDVGRLLNELDGEQRFQGLRRVSLDTGEVAWLCDEHRIAYRPSLVHDLHVQV